MDLSHSLKTIKQSFLDNWNTLIQRVPDIVTAIFIVVIGFVIADFLTKTFRKTIAKKLKIR